MSFLANVPVSATRHIADSVKFQVKTAELYGGQLAPYLSCRDDEERKMIWNMPKHDTNKTLCATEALQSETWSGRGVWARQFNCWVLEPWSNSVPIVSPLQLVLKSIGIHTAWTYRFLLPLQSRYKAMYCILWHYWVRQESSVVSS